MLFRKTSKFWNSKSQVIVSTFVCLLTKQLVVSHFVDKIKVSISLNKCFRPRDTVWHGYRGSPPWMKFCKCHWAKARAIFRLEKSLPVVTVQLFSVPFPMLRVSVNVLFLATQNLQGSERYLGRYGGGWSWSGSSERKPWVRNSNLPSTMWQIRPFSQLPVVWVVHPQFTLSPSVVLWCNKKYVFLALSPVTGTQLLKI